MSCKRSRSKRINNGVQQGWGIKKRRSQVRRNWVEMPADIMLLIFLKLGAIKIIENTQNVCSYWRKLAKEPILYKVIDFQGAEHYMPSAKNKYINQMDQFLKLAKEVVDRSCGQLVKLSTIEGLGWESVLCYVNDTNSIKSFHLRKGSCMSANELTDIVRRFGSVEELDICFGHFAENIIEQVGRTCKRLTSFRLRIHTFCQKNCDKELLIMARSLPQVRRLSLEGFLITTKGLQTILDGFSLLEHLDLEQCWRDKRLDNKNILKKCATRVTNVIPPSAHVSNVNYFELFKRISTM